MKYHLIFLSFLYAEILYQKRKKVTTKKPKKKKKKKKTKKRKKKQYNQKYGNDIRKLFHHVEIEQYNIGSYDVKHNKRSITILSRYDLRRCN